MRYKRAVEKLRLLADKCQWIGGWPPEDEPFLVAMYAFGDVVEGADPLEAVKVVGVIRLQPEEVPWGSSPHGTEWLADMLRLSKGGYEYWWRSYLDPVWNHYVRSPVRIWSQGQCREIRETESAPVSAVLPGSRDVRAWCGGWVGCRAAAGRAAPA